MNYFNLIHNIIFKALLDDCDNDSQRAGKLFEKIMGFKYEGRAISKLVKVGLDDIFDKEEESWTEKLKS